MYEVSGDRPNLSVTLVSTLVGGATDYHFGAVVCTCLSGRSLGRHPAARRLGGGLAAALVTEPAGEFPSLMP